MFRSAGRLPPPAACLTNAVRSFAALAAFRLNGTLRNITIFSDVSANTYTAVRRGGKKAGRQAPVEDAFILKGRFTMGRKVGKGYKRRFLLRGKRETVSLIIHKNLEGLKKRRKRLG